ncbi:hypothetical protein CVT26_014795 [Gymnopilus dilepis]|uniref:G-protein coupled receptors family 1 profile domain-containing protein n=1 Tax=Gymnopilus dilepis TaxID=231916 RepID=A0A409W9U1_9AGAR|nr:hypothetical protein CVT26_014795 [Gymnopilus dilepis]
MPAPPYPIPAQEDVIRGNLNSTLLSVLFLGIYSVIYFSSFCIYSSKRVSRHGIVVGTISLSYAVYVVAIACEWYQIQQTVVNQGDTRDTIFTATLETPRWYLLLSDICKMLMGGLADGLLIWRCYNVWNHSIRVILLPLLLLLAEIAVDLYVLKGVSDANLNASGSGARALDRLGAVLLFLTLATTLLTTLLISYRVYMVCRDSLKCGSATRFSQIIELLVQSAALYSVATLAYAIASVIPSRNQSLGPLVGIQYTSSFYLFSAGVAPTIMSIRVAFMADKNQGSLASHVSALQFEAHEDDPSNFTTFSSTNSSGTTAENINTRGTHKLKPG